MPEIKHNFTSGKMNKDLDERLVPNGEYRNALNLQVSVSEGSDVGAIENLLGNHNLTPNTFDPTARCLASIADEKLDTLYWFTTSFTADRITEYNVKTGVVTNVVVDNLGICLKFKQVNRVITGVNIIDGMLFWTDNVTEPKKINIKRCIAGTIGNNQTLLVNNDLGIGPGPGNTLLNLEESHITVIRKSPKNPLTIVPLKSRVATSNYTGVVYSTVDTGAGVPNGSSIINSLTGTNYYDFSSLEVGETMYLLINEDLSGSTTFTLDPVKWAVGKKVYLKEFEIDTTSGVVNAPAVPTTDYRIRAVIEAWPSNSFSSTAPVNSSANDWPVSDPNTASVKLKILSIDGFPTAANPNINGGVLPWVIDTWEDEQNLFEFKFPRFSYRYKYEDGEYSTFAPFSNIVFEPGSFDYHIKKGYNLGMTNKLTSIDLQNFITQDMPLDVVEIDLLYKEDGSPNIYVVETFSPVDDIPVGLPANTWYSNKYTVTSDTIHSILPSNQLLRPWDNVPRKALAQEIVGNRIVYANYLQNFDLKSGTTSLEYYPDFSIAIGSFSTGPVTAGFAFKSIKTLREYQLGVVFLDEYGRETPVLSNETGTLMLDKSNAANQNRFDINFQPGTQFPQNMKYMKFFVKETSGEYYNLAMGRYYDAEDGNIWLAFPSTDRAKIDEESFIILKKGSDSNDPVVEPARYKVIAIENDAPDFIKTVKLRMDKKIHSYITASGDDLFGPDMTTAPGIGDDYFELSYQPFASSSSAELHKIMREAPGDQIWVEFEMSTTSSGAVSNRYRVVELTCDYDPQADSASPDYISVANARYYFKIEGIFGDDVNFICDDPSGQNASQINEGAQVNIYRYKIENRPQFDGRFFVKILNDDIFRKYVNTSYASLSDDYKIVSSKKIYSLHDSVLNKWYYQGKFTTHGKYNPTPEIAAFLYNYLSDGNFVETLNHGTGSANQGANEKDYLFHRYGSGNSLYGQHEHIRYPDKNRYQAWFNEFRFFDATEATVGTNAPPGFGFLNKAVGAGGITHGAQHKSTQIDMSAWGSGNSALGTTITQGPFGAWLYPGAFGGGVPGPHRHTNPYGWTFEIGENAIDDGYIDPVDFNNRGTYWFLDGARKKGYKDANNDLDGSGGIVLTCNGASTALGSANFPFTDPNNGFYIPRQYAVGVPPDPGFGTQYVNGLGDTANVANGCVWHEANGWNQGWSSPIHQATTTVNRFGWGQIDQDNFTINLGFGGLYDDQWQTTFNPAGPQYYSVTGFFDLRSGGNTYHPKEQDFIDKLVPGTKWRWAEDPAQTVYTIGGAVEEHNSIRYCMLPHQSIQIDAETEHTEAWEISGDVNKDQPSMAASNMGGYNVVNGFTNPSNFTKNFLFANEDSASGFGKGWQPSRLGLVWNDATNDIINNDGYNVDITAAAAGTTAFNDKTTLNNYYIVVDSLIGTNTGAGAANVAIHKGLVLWSVSSGLNQAGEDGDECGACHGAFGGGNAAISLSPTATNTNYPTGAGTFWDDYSVDGGTAASMRWQALLVKKTAYDAATGGYRIYLTGYRRSMTKYDTVVPANGATLKFVQPKMNGFSPNFVENFHWMAWMWNNNANSPWDPTNFGVPHTAALFGDGMKHFEHGAGFNQGEYINKNVRLFEEVGYTLEILEPLGDIETYADDPAIWETEPKETTDLNIYYEASGYNPLLLTASTKYTAIPNASIITRLGGSGIMPNTTTTGVGGANDDEITVTDPINGAGSICVTVGGCPGNSIPNETVVGDTLNVTRLDGSVMTVTVTGFPNPTIVIGGDNMTDAVQVNNVLYNETYSLNWNNCYSYGNGVESNRIRDYFNLPFISNGVFASSTLGEQYKEERRTNGLIYSGLYNSISGINNLNQFIQAEKITKDINPSYGSIQKIHTRDTDLVTLCEDKVLRILANKDAVYNADGNTQLTATANVLGQSVPFVGEYGISTNPESFASESYRAYFSDKVRGAVLRLSKDGLTPISDHGMKDWFKDNLKTSANIFGSYDDNKDQYNITLNNQPFTPGYIINTACPSPWSGETLGCGKRQDDRRGSVGGAPWQSPTYGQYFNPIATTPPLYTLFNSHRLNSHDPLNFIDYLIDNHPNDPAEMFNVPLMIGGNHPQMGGFTTQAELNEFLTRNIMDVRTDPDGNDWTAKDSCCEVCTDGAGHALVTPTQFQVTCDRFGGFNISTTGHMAHPDWANIYGDPAKYGHQTLFGTWDDLVDKAINVANIPGITPGMGRIDVLTAMNAHYGFECNITISWRPCLCCPDCTDCTTITLLPPPSEENDKTLTFKENVKGWISFKSFIPEHAVSCASEYFTFKGGDLYQHHHMAPPRNNFYGQQYQSSFKVLMNDGAGSVKNFQTVNYEGSQTRVRKFTTQSVTDAAGITTLYNDKEYYNLTPRKGWWIQNIETDLQKGGIPEFIRKEGKWFNYIKGPFLNDSARPQFDEFAAQGIGGFENFNPNAEIIGCTDRNDMVNFNPNANIACKDVDGVTNGTALTNGISFDPAVDCCEPCVYGCMDPASSNYVIAATCDDGSCSKKGCTDPAALNYDPTATVDDGSCIYPNCGCMDGSQVMGEDASMGNGGGPIGILVNKYLNHDPLASCDCDCNCDQTTAWFGDTGCCDPAIYGCMDPLAPNYMPTANIQSNVLCTSTLDANGILQWQQDYCTCHPYKTYGCTDSGALNFDPNATIPCNDDASGPGNNTCCVYGPIPSWKCNALGICYDPGDGSGPYQTEADCISSPCLPSTTGYDCDAATGCFAVPGGGAYATLADCQTSCPTPGGTSWDCDPIIGCFDPGTGNGQYATLVDCQSICPNPPPPPSSQTWDCNPTIGCYDPGTGNGQYTTLSQCQVGCPGITPQSWDCDPVNGCVDPGTGNGQYSTLASCTAVCPGPTTPESWNCVSPGNCVDPGDGSGTYPTQAVCNIMCPPPPPVVPTWNCDPALGCVDPGDGSGLYNSLASCQTGCTPSSWICDPAGCYDPGDGSGPYSTYQDCIAAQTTVNHCTDNDGLSIANSTLIDGTESPGGITNYTIMDWMKANPSTPVSSVIFEVSFDVSTNSGNSNAPGCDPTVGVPCPGPNSTPNNPTYLMRGLGMYVGQGDDCRWTHTTCDPNGCGIQSSLYPGGVGNNNPPGSGAGEHGDTWNEVVSWLQGRGLAIQPWMDWVQIRNMGNSTWGTPGNQPHAAWNNYGCNRWKHHFTGWNYSGVNECIGSMCNCLTTCPNPPVPAASWDCVLGSCIDPGTGNGQYSSLAACSTSCNPPSSLNWACDVGTCISVAAGTGSFPTLQACQQVGCSPPPSSNSYRCASGVCAMAGPGIGPFQTMQDCLNAGCSPPPTGGMWKCKTGLGCGQDPTGTFASQALCNASCPPPSSPEPYKCGQTGCFMDPSGTYPTMQACLTAFNSTNGCSSPS